MNFLHYIIGWPKKQVIKFLMKTTGMDKMFEIKEERTFDEYYNDLIKFFSDNKGKEFKFN